MRAPREFPTPPQGGGVNTPNFHTTPPGFRGKEGERGRGRREGKGREGERDGERRREGKGPPRVG